MGLILPSTSIAAGVIKGHAKSMQEKVRYAHTSQSSFFFFITRGLFLCYLFYHRRVVGNWGCHAFGESSVHSTVGIKYLDIRTDSVVFRVTQINAHPTTSERSFQFLACR